MAHTVTGKATFVGCTGTATPSGGSALTIVGATLTIASNIGTLLDGAGEVVGTRRSAQDEHTLELECVVRATLSNGLVNTANTIKPPAPLAAVTVASFHTDPTSTYTTLINASDWLYWGDWKVSFSEDEVKVSLTCKRWYNSASLATAIDDPVT